MSALEGDMDARVAAAGGDRRVTAGLASAAALRAFGSAAAVALAPRAVTAMGAGWVSAALAAVLDTVLVVTLAWQLRPAAGAPAGYAAVGRMLWLRWKTFPGS